VSEIKCLNYEIGGVKLTLQKTHEIKAENKSSERYNVEFQDPANGFIGYRNSKFSPGVWCLSNPITWANVKDTGLVDINLTAKDKRYRVRVDIKKRKFKDITNPYIQIDNFVPVTQKVSVIIPAYKADKFLEKCIKGFTDQQDNVGEMDLEILVGIDSCWETLKEVSRKIYPENVKFYYFKENVGPYYIRNTLAAKSKNDILIFFDADDIPGETMIRTAIGELSKGDMARWEFFWFENDDQINIGNQLKIGFLTVGVFAIRKKKFFSRNGFYHWRVGADSEFHERALSKGMKVIDVHQPLFFRRNTPTSLTRDGSTGHKSLIRRAYNEIVDENSQSGFFPDPSELRTIECIRV